MHELGDLGLSKGSVPYAGVPDQSLEVAVSRRTAADCEEICGGSHSAATEQSCFKTYFGRHVDAIDEQLHPYYVAYHAGGTECAGVFLPHGYGHRHVMPGVVVEEAGRALNVQAWTVDLAHNTIGAEAMLPH